MPLQNSISVVAVVPDADLCTAALEGDLSAFRRIVERYQNLVCSIAYSAIGDVGRSEDLTQETFVVAWKNLASLQEPEKLKAWLCGITRRLISNTRRQASTDLVAHAEEIGVREPVAIGEAAPIDTAIRHEEEFVLWEVLSQLPAQFREPLVLYHRGQHSVAEVATQLDLSEDVVKQRLSRGRKLLRTEVATFVEKALRTSRPGPALAIAVLAALPAAAPQASAAALLVTAKGTAAKAAAAGSAATAGAVLGVSAGIASARSPRERRFMILITVFVGVLVAALLAIQAGCIHLFPAAYRTITFQVTFWGVYSLLLVALIWWSLRRVRQIRKEDGTATGDNMAADELSDAPLRAVIWSLAGAMCGGISWIAVAGQMAGDWLTPTVAIAVTVGCWFAIKRWLESADSADRRVLSLLMVVAVIASVGLVAATLRWSAWETAGSHYARQIPLWVHNLILGAVCLVSAIPLMNRYRAVRRRTE